MITYLGYIMGQNTYKVSSNKKTLTEGKKSIFNKGNKKNGKAAKMLWSSAKNRSLGKKLKNRDIVEIVSKKRAKKTNKSKTVSKEIKIDLHNIRHALNKLLK